MLHARHGSNLRDGDLTPIGQTSPSGKFGRLFPALQPLQVPLSALEELGATMVESPAAVSGDNSGLPAGYTYLGQFIDHDITFDTTTIEEARLDRLALRNFRTPALDLDCLYGSGPRAQPFLYQRLDSALFQVGATSSIPGSDDAAVPVSMPFDLPRGPQGLATIGDPRNDENLVVAQTHLAFLRFHNRVVEGLRDGSVLRESPIRKSDFDEARDLVIRHYQWMVFHDFLPRILDKDELKKVVCSGASLYMEAVSTAADPFIPLEFSAAAYRFGHSMVREAYDHNRVFSRTGKTPATLGLLFRFSGRSSSGNTVPIPSDWIIDWRRFFPLDNSVELNLSRLIDPYLAPTLTQIPAQPTPLNLAVLNLHRGSAVGLPPAQSIARSLGYPVLDPEAIAASGPDGAAAAKHKLHIESPLWFYCLKEAQLLAHGKHLGPLGSRIVAETITGLLLSDASSFISRNPNWRPTLGPTPGEFTMADMLRFTGDLNPIG